MTSHSNSRPVDIGNFYELSRWTIFMQIHSYCVSQQKVIVNSDFNCVHITRKSSFSPDLQLVNRNYVLWQ